MSNIQASIITIGDELLIGQTIDTNSAWLAQRLNDLGIVVKKRVAVGDVAEDITEALDEALEEASLVILTGGLGPTADDITKPLLCKYFGGKLVVNEPVLAHVKAIFQKRNRPMLETNLKQAEVPDNCTVLFNNIGTAPGMWFNKDEKVVISLPGVPFEMIRIMEDEVIERLQQQFVSDAIMHRSVITAGEGESFIADRIKDLEAALPQHIKLAYLPSPGMVKLRLTGTGQAKDVLVKELTMRQEEIANRLEDIVVSLDDIPFEQILGKLLMHTNVKLGLAESCTGGYIAHYITQVIGSSSYFKGSIVCYQPEIKESVLGVKKSTLEKHGAVSEETAIEMVSGTLKVLGADIALSITGLLSPGGEEDKTTPVGTVWMAVADKNRVKTKQFHFHYDRPRNKEISVQMAMLMIWRFLNNKL
jgi:nicotinamide-nucleotide amidase